MKKVDAEKAEAIERLREYIKPGDTIHTQMKHCSKSGMLRVIQLIKLEANPDGSVSTFYLGSLAARAMGDRYDREREGIRIGGCGMDMGAALVYNLSYTLWPKGYECYGDKCRSNDHSNGDQDRTPHLHKDGGYCLSQKWL